MTAPHHLQPGDHACQLVDGPAGRLAAVAFQTAAAAAAGQQLLVLTGAPDPDGLAELAGRAAGNGRAGLRLVADLAWPATDPTAPARFATWEDRLSRLTLTGPVTAVCLYDSNDLDRDTLWRLVPAHAVTLTATGEWSARLGIRRLPGGGLRLTGEADVTNRRALWSALEVLLDSPPATGGATVVDVTGLSFVDAGAARLLIRAAAAAPGGLRVDGAHPIVARVLALLGTASPTGPDVRPGPGALEVAG